ncbi:hypothetical protein QE152_g7792 [Popillia japonica]|uniref:Uncharacterized protein n=1 Tax=Popillia japonica TaxID=7064 RepID=A0AAW1MEB2_POPJA
MDKPENVTQTPYPDPPGPFLVSPKDIQPVPRLSLPTTSNSRAGSAAIVSGSPYKTALEESLERKKISKRKLPFEKQQTDKQKKKRNKIRRTPSPNLSLSDDEDCPPYVSTDDSDSTNHDDDGKIVPRMCQLMTATVQTMMMTAHIVAFVKDCTQMTHMVKLG